MLERIRKSLFRETYKKGIDPKDLYFVKRCGGDFTSEGRAIIEVFGPRSETPIWVVKANRSARGNARLAAEFERLQSLERGSSEDIVESIPQPVLIEESPTGSFSIETFIEGEKLSTLFRNGDAGRMWRNWENFGRAALHWLERYNESMDRWDFSFASGWFVSTVSAPLKSHSAHWVEISPSAARLLEKIGETPDPESKSLRTVVQHGDYTPGNLIAMEGRLGVIDWSPADREAPPLMDLFQFVLSSAIYLEKGMFHGSGGGIEGRILREERFWDPIRPELRTAFLQAGVKPGDRTPLFRAAVGRKILNGLNKPSVVESSLRDWCGLLGNGGLKEAEEKLLAI